MRDTIARRKRASLGLSMLDCYFCGKNYRDFTELAAHVKLAHRDSTLRSPSNDDNRESAENKPMAKSAAKQSKGKSDDKREFLRHTDLARRGTTTITFDEPGSIRTFDGKFGVQLVVDVHVNGEPFALGIKLNSANHIALDKKLGRNLLNWPGATVKAAVKTFEGDRGTVEYIELENAGDRERERD